MDDFNARLNDAIDNSLVGEVEKEWDRSPYERLGKVLFVTLATLGANMLFEKLWDRQFRNEPQKDNFIDTDIIEDGPC